MPLSIALCNEVLQPLDFEAQCRMAAALGYDALELAPFTLAEDPTRIGEAKARQWRRIAEDAGLRIAGLHWLLVAPPGLSLVSEDAALRERTHGVMSRLVGLCAALGGRYLVHGSPKQRSVPAGSTRAQALDRVTEGLARVAEVAQAHGLVYCLEPLSTRETDLVNTVAEAAAIVDAIGSPALRTMLDCSAAGQMEAEPISTLLERWVRSGHVAHVQLNDPNRRGPGQGALGFAPILRTLCALQAEGAYRGCVAVEPFDYQPDGPGCAARAIGYLRGLLEAHHAAPASGGAPAHGP